MIERATNEPRANEPPVVLPRDLVERLLRILDQRFIGGENRDMREHADRLALQKALR